MRFIDTFYARFISLEGGGCGAWMNTTVSMHCAEQKQFQTTYFELCGTRHHLLKTNTNTFNDSKKDSASNGTVSRRLVAATDGE